MLEGVALVALAAIGLGQGRPDEAVELAGRASAIQGETGHRVGEARARTVLAAALHHRGDHSAAQRHRRAADRILAEVGTPVGGPMPSRTTP
jgi:hypothetical protein